MPSPHAAHWALEPGTTHLNHGSFGATPRVVLDAQQQWRARMEVEPVRFFVRDLEGLLDEARAELGTFVGADGNDLAFIPNATTGLSTVLRSLQLEPGDELLTTDHAYDAATNAMEYVAERAGARVVVAPIAFPHTSPEAVRAAVLEHASDRTRLAVLDHVTSATALVFPVRQLIAELSERGAETLVDGAHAPGMVDLAVADLGAAYYTANLHKWVSAPKGAAFLWVRPDLQQEIQPLAISHGASAGRADRSRFRLDFDWTGTADPSAFLCVPDAIRFGASLLPGGWPALRARNHDLAVAGRDLVCRAIGVGPPVDDEMLGSMVSLPLPGLRLSSEAQGVDLYGDPVHDALVDDHGIQVLTATWPQRPEGGWFTRLLRFSAAAYNDIADVERLARALPLVLAGLPRTDVD